MKDWKKIIENSFNDKVELVCVIIDAPEEYKREAWLRLLRSSPETGHFLAIVSIGSDNYKEKAWEKFLDNFIEPYELLQLIESKKFPEKYRVLALRKIIVQSSISSYSIEQINKRKNKGIWKEFLKQKLTNDELCNIIKNGPVGFQDKAWNQLLERNQNIDIYREIICAQFHSNLFPSFPDRYKEKSWEEFLKQNPTIDDLCLILNGARERYYKDKAWEKLIKRMPITYDFICKINKINIPKEYRKKAWWYILGKKLSNYELFLVIEKGLEECKIKAWEQLLKQNPDKNDLDLVIAFAPKEYIKKAEEVLNKRKDNSYG